MAEMDIDAIVARLVPEFEITKVAAIMARDDYLAQLSGPCVNCGMAFEAHRRWHRLEAACHAILRHIDELAECNAA